VGLRGHIYQDQLCVEERFERNSSDIPHGALNHARSSPERYAKSLCSIIDVSGYATVAWDLSRAYRRP